jgi:hypothetical protein
MAPEVQDPILHFSTCLQRNDFCTVEPLTIIYSSPHRPVVHDTKVKAILRDDPSQPPPPIPTTHSPSKRSLAPVTDVDDVIARFNLPIHFQVVPLLPPHRQPMTNDLQGQLTMSP